MPGKLKRFNGYTVPDICALTGLTRESARNRLKLFVQGRITEDHLLRPAAKTRPKARR